MLDNSDSLILVYHAGDLISVLSLFVLAAEISRQKHNNSSLKNLLLGILLLGGGISFRVFGGVYGITAVNDAGLSHGYSFEALVHTVIAALLIVFSLGEFFIEITDSDNEPELHRVRRTFFITALILWAIASGFFLNGYTNKVFNIIYILQLIIMTNYCLYKGYVIYNRKTILIACYTAVAPLALRLILPVLNIGRLGLTFMYIIVYIEYMSSTERELIQKELELSESRIQLLMEQISPHFIFNSLQTIEGICDTDPAMVKPSLEMFSQYLRANLESLTTTNLIHFSKELEHTKNYIELEKMGGGKEFDVEYRLGVENFMMPPLVLQPLVENAIRYGVGASTEGDKVIIETIDAPDRIIIKVMDEAHGENSLTQQQKKKKSIGLNNVKERLAAQCNGTLELERTATMTTARVELPKTLK